MRKNSTSIGHLQIVNKVIFIHNWRIDRSPPHRLFKIQTVLPIFLCGISNVAGGIDERIVLAQGALVSE
jgi:hypothetical protein